MFSASGFEAGSFNNRRWGWSVRLATVVSGLTGDGLLFLPAAGNCGDGTIRYAGTVVTYQCTDLSTDVRQSVRFRAAADGFQTDYRVWRSWGPAVRLATVVSGLAGDLSFCSCLLRVFNMG